MTETEQVPTTNGLPEETEEDDKTKIRPPDIDADMREMERRKRVEMLMSSRLFREELERIIESQMKEGGGPAGLLQQIQDMVGGASRLQSNIFRGSNCVLPINDIRGLEAMGYAKGEKILRCKLASVFRLMDLYGWSNGIHNLITGRLAQDDEEFVVNPHGLMYHEVTASSLVKVDMQGNVLEQGTTNFNVNATTFKLHAALHAARPDIKCVVHVRNPPVLAISSLKCGLLPVSAESAVIGEVSSHQYIGSAAEPEERDKIARSLGPVNKVLLLTNHGALCCGETIEEAFFNVYNTVLACETQVKLMPLGIDNLITLPDEGRKSLYDSARKAPVGDKKWRVGGLEFEALMRMLDNAGFRTGYIYRSPLVKNEPPKPKNDVEVPPAVSSLGYLLEEEEMYKQGNWKKGGVNRNDRSRWLNSPNVYQKVEILETGTTDPKKITKWVDANNAEEWVADGSPAHTSTPVKIDAALQFVPKNTNPKEFKKLQQQIKENRRADKITSGPQSHILEGVTWEEAKKLQDANISMTGDQVILVGAASKGIIQRGFQHNATVYKSPYAKNPFDCVSEQELEEYKNVVTKKQKGEYYADDTEQSESEALSSSVALIKSEQEDTSEPRVLRIETKTAPAPSQAEVVLSDDDFPDPHVERSKSQRYPMAKDAVLEIKRSSSADRTNKDFGDGHVVKCQLLDDVTMIRNSRLLHRTIGTQTKLRIYIDSRGSSSEDIPFACNKSKIKTASVPDLVKIGLPLDRFKIMSNVIKELNSRFNKVVQQESVKCLEIQKSISVPSSPTGFSSGDTSSSYEYECVKEMNIKKSMQSLQDHIGEDFEATIELNSPLPLVPTKELSPELITTYFENHYDNKTIEKGCSCESLLGEQDNTSLKTFVSSSNISLVGIRDAEILKSNSSIDDFLSDDQEFSEPQKTDLSYRTVYSSTNSSQLLANSNITAKDLINSSEYKSIFKIKNVDIPKTEVQSDLTTSSSYVIPPEANENNSPLTRIEDSDCLESCYSIDDLSYDSTSEAKDDLEWIVKKSKDFKKAIASTVSPPLIADSDLSVCKVLDFFGTRKLTSETECVDNSKTEPLYDASQSFSFNGNNYSFENNNAIFPEDTDNNKNFSCDTTSKNHLPHEINVCDIKSNKILNVLHDFSPNRSMTQLEGSLEGYDAENESTF